jgi:bacterioferritin-associated ferredoxin
MYVCICNAIRESDIKTAVDSGISRASDYFRNTGLRPQCGHCVSSVQSTIDAHTRPPSD